MKLRKIVIGGGISGLSFGLYHWDSMVISNKVTVDSPFVFIQVNLYTKQLLEDLGLNVDIVDVRIIPRMVKSVIDDKIGGDQSNYIGTDRIANIGEGSILQVYNIKESIVADMMSKILCAEKRLRMATVVKVIPNKVFLDTGECLEYEELISTIHYDIFSKIANWTPGNIISKSMFLKILEEKAEQNIIDYCKIPGAKWVSNTIADMVGVDFGDNRQEGCVEVEAARFTGMLNPPPKNVIFSGRFATANSHWRIEDSLFLAQEGYIFAKMFAEQRRFDAAVQWTGKTLAADRIKNLILHIYSEANELLQCADTDWKSHLRSSVKKKASSVLEEGIDILKLVFAVLHMHSYTEREIYEAFWIKSSKLWVKFLDAWYGGC